MADVNKNLIAHPLPGETGDHGYYTVKEIADRIGFHKDTVYEWIYSRGMPVRRSVGRGRITVYWPEFVEWWKESKIRAV